MSVFERLRYRIRTHGNVLARRWYLVALTILCMLPVLYAAHLDSGVFYGRADVLFLPPPASVGGNSLRADPGRTVYYAAIVDRQFNGEEGTTGPRATDAPLYGTGIRSGHAVFIPNAGGQWQTNFNKPVIAVEVVGETSAEVQQDLDRILAKIQALALVPQQKMGVNPDAFIYTELSPEKPSINYVGIRNSRAEAVLMLLMMGMAFGAAHVGDRLILHFSKRQALRSAFRKDEVADAAVRP